MAAFLHKSKQRLEHTNKLSVGEFKSLQSIIGQNKNLLNSHLKVAADLKKASHALDEWAQAEGADLGDTLSKVAKLLSNDLAKAEEEYADHLSNFRMYFKQLRTREEKFSQLKKNKDSLQGKIDAAEKKLARMSPEHKDMPTWTQKLSDLRSEMIGMENSVINEEAAIGDYRRHTARSAVSHQLAALCQLGEKMTIIGELGKLLTYEIRLDTTEPGRDRAMYTSHDRTMQIYGEAQTCLHKVVFDSSNTEPAYGSLPVPQRGDFDQSYEYEQEAQRGSYDADNATNRQSYNSRDSTTNVPITSAVTSPTDRYQHEQQPASRPPEEIQHNRLQPSSSSYQPLATPTHVDLENEFSEAVNASWPERAVPNQGQPSTPQPQATPWSGQNQMHAQGSQNYAHEPLSYDQQVPNHKTQAVLAQDFAASSEDAYGGQEYSRDSEYYNEPPQLNLVHSQEQHSQLPDLTVTRDGISTIEEETSSALHGAESSSTRDANAARVPSEASDIRLQRHQLHDGPVPSTAPQQVAEAYELAEAPSERIEAPVRRDLRSPTREDLPELPSDEAQQGTDAPENNERHTFEPSGDDLYGTGLYGGAHTEEALNDHDGGHEAHYQPDTHQEPPEPYSETPNNMTAPAVAPVPVIAEPAYEHEHVARSPAATSVSARSTGEQPLSSSVHQDLGSAPRETSPRPSAHSPSLQAASALAAAAAASVRPPANNQASSKSVPRVQVPSSQGVHHSYTTVATSNKAPTPLTSPSSPTRRERTPPVKQNSYRSENRARQNSNEGYGRSSIAYLNETPRMEPPMKAPPPINLGMPLPSSSPYFNPYANLRSNSGSQQDHSGSVGGAPSGSSGKPKGARSSGIDTTLGSKHGFDMRAVQNAHDRPLQQQPVANVNPGVVREKDYSYAIKSGEDGGGRRLAAGAFRRSNPSSSSIPSFSNNTEDGAMSPAQRLQQEWRQSQANLAPPQAAFATTPAGSALSTPAEAYVDAPDQMFGDHTNASRAHYTHRTSAVDAPTDVLPNDETSHSDLHHLAEDDNDSEPVLPLNLRKKSITSVSEVNDSGART